MSLTFSRVPTVAVGSKVTSTQYARLVDSGNGRLRVNAGDFIERIVYTMLSTFRQIRNPSELGAYAPQAEYWTAGYQGLKPTDANWPVAAMGDPEGIRLSNWIGAFVGGAAGIGLYDESTRLAEPAFGGVPLTNSGSPILTRDDAWQLGKDQRGGVDIETTPGTQIEASAAFDAATQHYKMQPNPTSPDGNSYGGYMPAPLFLGLCSDGESPSFQIKFTKLSDSSTVTYPGTCPGVTGDVAGIVRAPTAYYVWVYGSAAPDVYPYSNWIEGPYESSVLKHEPSEIIPRVMNTFVGDFRGTAAERASQTQWLQYAFEVERFLLSQYFLAPARGTWNGTTETVDVTYPGSTTTLGTGVTTIAAGTVLQINGASSYAIHDGFVLGAAFSKNHRLSSGTIEVYDVTAAEVIGTIELTPDGSGVGDILTFERARKTTVQIRCATDLVFTNDTGWIVIEIAELLDYKPQNFDLALVLRLSAARETLSGGLNGSGEVETNARDMSDSYFATGAIVNQTGAATLHANPDEINSNAMFDAARRLSQCVKVVPRAKFLGYEVTGGKSICYFQRLVTFGGVDVDLFEGIGPSRTPVDSGSIEAGVVYVAREDAITYNGTVYIAGQTFTGIAGVTEFTANAPESLVFFHEGIIPTARNQGLTNEWVMSAFLKVYNTNSESEWYPDSYSDYWFWSERCHFYHPTTFMPGGDYNYPSDFTRLIDYTTSRNVGSHPQIAFAPEALTGWRYAKGTNRWNCPEEGDAYHDDCVAARLARYKSCRIYEPAPEIESATVLIESGVEVIKLVFKSRFHHHDAAPSSIARDVSTWDITGYRTSEGDSRTLENALRDYLIYQYDGTHCQAGGWDGSGHDIGQQGNAAHFRNDGESVWSQPDNPSGGACFPDFYFVRLLRKPREDGNDAQNAWDSPLMHDLWREHELYLSIGCQGFVDDLSSQEISCVTGINAIFCFTRPTLCFKAFSGRAFQTLATAATSRISSSYIRSDKPEGFGQLQNCLLSSEIYNQFAKAWNELTKVQIMLPTQFQVRYSTGAGSSNVALSWPDPPPDCSRSDGTKGYYEGTPPAGSADTPGSWTDDTGGIATAGAAIECQAACEGTAWKLTTDRQDFEWRWRLVDPDAIYAIPEVWRDLVVDGSGNFSGIGRVLAVKSTVKLKNIVTLVDNAEEASPCLGTDFGFWVDPDTGKYLKFETVDDGSPADECLVLSSSGTLMAPNLSSSVFPVGFTAGTSCCSGVQNSVSITPILGDDTTYVEVPLV